MKLKSVVAFDESLGKRELGRTNLLVTPICWGCAPLGNMPNEFGHEVSETQAIATLSQAFDSGINFLDTASVYGDSESRIGGSIRTRGGLPEGFIAATKADRNPETNMFSASQTRKSVEGSCERLGLKSLPLVYLHDPEHDPRYKSDRDAYMGFLLGDNGPVCELEILRDEGKISHIGISGGPVDMLLSFIRTGRFEVVITHNRWNLLWQVADPLIDEAKKRGIGVVNAAPYAGGILATGGKGNARATYQIPSPEIIERVEEIGAVCKKHEIPLPAAALQFSLRDRRIDSTVVGVSTPTEVTETLRLARLPIPDKLWEELRPLAIKDHDPEIKRK